MMVQRCENGFKLRKLNHGGEEKNATQIDSNITQENNPLSKPKPEETQRTSAKNELYKLCSVRHWKPPVYEYCNHECPCHMTLFIVKATVEIKEVSGITILECFGDPQHKKEIGVEQAAEAALWYLKNVVRILQTDKAAGDGRQIKRLQKMKATV